jgi:hypothetical protein
MANSAITKRSATTFGVEVPINYPDLDLMADDLAIFDVGASLSGARYRPL